MGTLGMVHPQLCSVAQHQSRIKQNPFKTNTTTIQQPHNNHTTTTQQSYMNNRNRPQGPRAAPVPPLATLRYGATGEAGGLPEEPPPPPRPQGRRRHHPSPHCASAPRRGEGGRWPTRRAAPTPQDPKGGAGATSRHPAPRRDERARRPTRGAVPTIKKVTPRPLR